jgi:hypothetical protein
MLLLLAGGDERGLLRVSVRREDTAGARRMIETNGRPQFIAGAPQIWVIEPRGRPARE